MRAWLPELRHIVALAFPMIIGQMSQMLLGLADTWMVAKLGVLELAALSLVNALFHVPLVLGIGVLTSVAIRVSAARGSGDSQRAREACRTGFYLSLILGALCFLISWAALPFLGYLGQPAHVVERSHDYYLIVMLSMIPCLGSLALKNHADAMNRAWTAFWIFLAGVLFNILLNWLLIFGKAGFPEMGLEGAGLATLIARIGICAAMLVWFSSSRRLADWTPRTWWKRINGVEMRRLLKLGIPAGLHTLSEVGAFSAAGLLCGLIGAMAMAGHQVALTVAGMSFMIPLGLSMALTVCHGEARGQEDVAKLRRLTTAGWSLTLVIGVVSAALLMIFSQPIAAAFVDEPEIISLAASLLVVAGVFQIVDGLQVASAGMLRGLEDVHVPAIIGVLSYWVVGIPLGAWFAFSLNWGAKGIWWGLAAGLSVAAVFLGWRLRDRLGRLGISD